MMAAQSRGPAAEQPGCGLHTIAVSKVRIAAEMTMRCESEVSLRSERNSG